MLVQVLNTTCLFVSNIYLYFKIELENNNWDMRLPIAIVIWRIKKIIWKIGRLVIYQILRLILQYLLTIYNPTQWTHITSVIIRNILWLLEYKGPFHVKKLYLSHLCLKTYENFWHRLNQRKHDLLLHVIAKWFGDKSCF